MRVSEKQKWEQFACSPVHLNNVMLAGIWLDQDPNGTEVESKLQSALELNHSHNGKAVVGERQGGETALALVSHGGLSLWTISEEAGFKDKNILPQQPGSGFQEKKTPTDGWS